MFSQVPFSDVLPLRAIAFQFLFLLVAIAIEGFVLHRLLNWDYKTSIQYAATVNLLSTVLGWVLFFNIQSVLPEGLRIQLISYIFFEQFFPNPWSSSIPSLLVVVSLGIFFSTFFIKLKGFDLLDFLLEKSQAKEAEVRESKPAKFRGRKNQPIVLSYNSRAYAVLVANSCSFSAILFLLLIRLIEHSRYTVL